jgi:hypothetical protein
MPGPYNRLSHQDKEAFREMSASQSWCDGVKAYAADSPSFVVGCAVGGFLFGLLGIFGFVFAAGLRWTFHHIMSGFRR